MVSRAIPGAAAAEAARSERWGWTPDAGYRPGQDKSEGYRNTAGFVTFSPLFYEGFGIEYDFKGDGRGERPQAGRSC